MFSKQRMNSFTADSSARLLDRLHTTLKQADAVLIGAGAGLSTSAGFTYSGERFKRYFSDFEAKYDFHDMYTGGFYPYQSLEPPRGRHFCAGRRLVYGGRAIICCIPIVSHQSATRQASAIHSWKKKNARSCEQARFWLPR